MTFNLYNCATLKRRLENNQLDLFEKANNEISKKVYSRAINYLLEALKIEAKYQEEVLLALVKCYLENNQEIKAQNTIEDYINNKFVGQDTFLLYADLLCERGEYQKALSLLVNKERALDSKGIEKKNMLYYAYDIIDLFSNEVVIGKKYFSIKEGISWGYYNRNNSLMIKDEYESITPFLEKQAIVIKDNMAYLIDTNGVIISGSGFKVEKILPYSQGRAGVKVNSEYVYVDHNFRTTKQTYLDLGTYADGYAAFKDSNGWGIRDIDGKVIVSGCEEILFDEFKRSTVNMRVFIKNNNTITLYDLERKKEITEFVDAKAFIDREGYAAVKFNTLWGFIDSNGETMIKAKWEQAKSFSCGLAAVRVHNKWGFIDESGSLVIMPKFDEVSSFIEGVSKVRIGDIESLLILKRYKPEQTFWR